MKLSSVAVIVTSVITIVLAALSNTAFQQIVIFCGGTFTVLVILALYLIGVIPAPSLYSKDADSTVQMTDTQIIGAVTSMRSAGYDDALIASSLQIDMAVVDAIPRNENV
ncbi:hypothetical protein [Pantoea agglomerans]|uniref:Uncharacterized protein n=1 Tax=Enterobacter agglomerans TaxID=549 RepID=A0ACC5RR22_ENTAG|nr:hypothetical protein [Pantoea agglomerans]MBK4727171.1 hypothetical protein [Pantoea agglomerans]